jgi:hypothetical protein
MDIQLTPLAVALQGIGYGSHLVALQGFLAVDSPTPPPQATLPEAGHHRSPRRRSRRIPRAVAPSVAIHVDTDDEELTLQLLSML